jgi:hypothetical protein
MRMLRSLVGTILCLLILASCKLELNYDKYAIVYGISDYPSGFNDLASTDDDARDMNDLLSNQGFQVIVRVTDDGIVDPTTPANPPNIDEATYDQLGRDFQAVAAQADLDDLFLFYYSGHGDQVPSALSENTPGSDSQEEVLVLVDDAPVGMPISAIRALYDDELATLLTTIPCARKIVILDSCYSGGFIGNSAEADAIPPDFTFGPDGLLDILGNAIYLYSNYQDYGSDIPPTEAMVLAASGERDFAYETSSGNGVMTTYLMESAVSGDLNRDGYITVSESFNYIYRNINENFNAVMWPIADVFFPHVSGGPIDYILFSKK